MENKLHRLIFLTVVFFFAVGVQAQKRNARYVEYINKYSDLAVEQMKLHKIPASITLAQGLLESGAGYSQLARKSNNHFGIKCGGSWRGRTVRHDDDARNECFRAYKHPRDSYEDHSDFLRRGARYAFLFNPICTPQESDEFDGYTLSPQWQWHANINEKWAYYAGDQSIVRLYSYPVVKEYKNLFDVANLLLQKAPAPNFTATMKLTFKPVDKYKGERTGLVVMGMDYAGLILENTDKGLVLSQVSCLKADKGTPEQVNGTVDLTDNTIYLKVKFSSDANKKISKSEGGHDLLVMCDFSYSLDGKKYQPLGKSFQAKEGKWIGVKVGTFCTRPAITTNDGGWADVDWFRITKK